MFHGLSKLLSNNVLEHFQSFIISIKPNFHWDHSSSLSSLYKPVKSLGDPWQQLLSLQCLLGNSCCVKAKSSSCSVEIDVLRVAECECGRTIFLPHSPASVAGEHSHQSPLPASHEDEILPCVRALAGKAASSEHLKREFWVINHSQSRLLVFEIQQKPPCAPQERDQHTRARFTTQESSCWSVQATALSKVHTWLPSLLDSPEIFLLIPLSAPQADHGNITVFKPASRAFVGLGRGQQPHFFSHLHS